ncbi:MAG: class B sortase [Bacillota bacterium]|nr:class B sortase [Bacillota bacterium]
MSKKRKPLGIGRWIILVICAIVFCGSLAYLGMWFKESLSARKNFSEVSEKMHESGNGLADIYALNRDTIAWVSIEDTKIDYPVMQTKDDPEYYLRRDFNREYSESGTPFMDAGSRVGDEPTWNWFIYGHNMKFGTMFHDLLEYDSRDFWEEHRTLELQIITGLKEGKPVIERGEYEIFAAARSKIREKDSGAFKYYGYARFDDEEKFHAFVRGVKEEALYDTGITPKFGQQLVTLSTCAYHVDSGRFYIVAVRK